VRIFLATRLELLNVVKITFLSIKIPYIY
jgi:hypothetical protein